MSKWYSSSKKRGTTGGNTYSIVNGQTIEREKAVSVKNPRTALQMSQRVKWANLIFFWTLSGEAMLKGFINKLKNQSWFNAFMSLNLGQPGTYLTKQEADAKTCIAAPYYVARGPLSPANIVSVNPGYIIAGLNLGTTAIDTFGKLSSAIINNNAGWQNGDKLCCLVTKGLYDSLGIVRNFDRKDLVLDVNSAAALPSFLSVRGEGTTQNPYVIQIAFNNQTEEGINSAALVHTRKVANKISTSTQKMQILSTSGDDHRTEAYKQQAIASYETEPAVFYDPDAE